eukprot:11304840-Alexandrium_andersonii.AAC.1
MGGSLHVGIGVALVAGIGVGLRVGGVAVSVRGRRAGDVRVLTVLLFLAGLRVAVLLLYGVCGRLHVPPEHPLKCSRALLMDACLPQLEA